MNLLEAKTFSQELISLYGLRNITLRLADNRIGNANYFDRILTLPYWLFNFSNNYNNNNKPLEYQYYYVLHEICHFIVNDKHRFYGHQGLFRETERKMLSEFGLVPIYARAYVKQLKTENGETIYTRNR